MPDSQMSWGTDLGHSCFQFSFQILDMSLYFHTEEPQIPKLSQI